MNADPRIVPIRLAALAFMVSMLVGALKVGAWWWTGSVTLLADATESALDVVTASLLVVSVYISTRPPDASHPWGHGKAEYFASGFQGLLIAVAGLGVGREAALGLGKTPEPLVLGLGLVLSIIATATNLALAYTLVREGRRLRSPALEGDGWHNTADVLTTVGGWVGLGLAALTGWWLLDPLVGLLLAVHILWTGFTLVRGAVAALMDASLPEEQLRALTQVLQAVVAESPGSSLHDVRARTSAVAVFVECTLRVPGDRSVTAAHELCDQLEAAAEAHEPGAQVLVHIEPAD